uniref:DUF1120 domain-containing protein n=1 Tax=Pseudomonas laurentiana TaxID=2364649 RepID=UPI0029C91FF0|nr:DUF1120 domain-containing protein [Pseudomonas laurentiana]
MKIVRNVLIGSACLIGATNAFASESADLRIKGIISPAACTPAFSGNIDYGYINPRNLNPTEHTKLTEKKLNYTITCAAPVSFGSTWTDARTGSESDGHDELLNDFVFGLGLQGSNKIGKYFIENDRSITADGKIAGMIHRPISGGDWELSDQSYKIGKNTIHAYATEDVIEPGSYANITSSVKVTTYIAPTENLDMGKNIELDGLATMTLRYL